MAGKFRLFVLSLIVNDLNGAGVPLPGHACICKVRSGSGVPTSAHQSNCPRKNHANFLGNGGYTVVALFIDLCTTFVITSEFPVFSARQTFVITFFLIANFFQTFLQLFRTYLYIVLMEVFQCWICMFIVN